MNRSIWLLVMTTEYLKNREFLSRILPESAKEVLGRLAVVKGGDSRGRLMKKSTMIDNFIPRC